MRHRICATWVVAAAAVGLLASVAEAHSAKLSCGQVLTADVRLAAGLTNCPGDGLVVGADGITIDLNGHALDGVAATGECGPPFPAPSSGVNVGGYDAVTVKNGTIQQFNTGVSGGADNGQAGMSDSRIHDLVLRDNRFGGVSMGGIVAASTARNRVDHNVISGGACSTGLDLNTGVGNRFVDNRVQDVGTGVVICCGDTSDGNVVADNEISRTAQTGILVFATGSARVVDNTLSDIGANGIGIIYAASSGTLVAGNRLTRVTFEGIGVFGCVDPIECPRGPEIPTGVRVVDNALEATGDGIILDNTDGDVVRGNTITHAASFGPPDNLGVGIVLDGVSDTLVAANDISGGGRGPAAAIVVGVPPEFDPSPRAVSRNTVTRNSVQRQSGDGIFVAALATGTTLLANEADRNGADGIHVLSAATTLTHNQADRNALHGIEAVAGVADGGGNRARGNGTSPQCTGVAC